MKEEIEKQLVNYVIQLEARFYRLIPLNLRKLAFQIAKVSGLVTRFDNEKEIAGKKWLPGFLKRHSEISLPLPVETSLARASGFNHTQIETFFNLLTEIIDENNISGQTFTT